MGYLARFALSIGAGALFAGCGGSLAPNKAPGAISQSRVIVQREHGKGRLLPEVSASNASEYKVSKSLLYVTNYTYNNVTAYPANAKDPSPIETISDDLNAPAGEPRRSGNAIRCE